MFLFTFNAEPISMHYFKYRWDETTGEEITDSWGCSIFYLETNLTFYPTRQLQLFDNGNALKYDTGYLDDKLGGLGDQPIDPEDFTGERIDKEEFEEIWNNTFYKQFPEIVCTPDISWGQPRLDGRRLTVGDIVSLAGTYTDLTTPLKDFELSLQEIRQALHYCKIQQCKKDLPDRFCHNCLLRVEQFNEAVDKDDPEQANWLRAARLLEKYFSRG